MRHISSLLALTFTVLVGCSAPSEVDSADSLGGAFSGSGGAAANPSSELKVEGLTNLRDLGGYATASGKKVRMGRVLRSQELAAATREEDLERLGLEVIIDFRGRPEVEHRPDPVLRGTKRVEIPIFDDANADNDLGAQLFSKLGTLGAAKEKGNARATAAAMADLDAWATTLDQRMLDSYATFVNNPEATAKFRAFLEQIAAGKVTLFHCVSGKDRTGFAAAILLRGLGVSWADVMNDYLETNDRLSADNDQKIDHIRQLWPGAGSLKTILGVDEAFLTKSFSEIQREYGTNHPPKDGEVASDEAIAAFYKAKFGPDMQSKLQRLLLE